MHYLIPLHYKEVFNMATVRKLKSGNYQAIATIDGKRVSATGKTQDEALQAVFSLFSASPAPSAPSAYSAPSIPSAPSITVGEAIDRYITAKECIISPTTCDTYRGLRRNQFSMLMALPLNQLTQEIVQIAVNNEAKLVSAKTVANAYGLLTATLGMFAPSLHLSVTLPRRVKKDIYVPDNAEIARIFDHIKDYNKGRLIKPYLLATQCGLRASEIAGLTTDCVKSDCIIINKAKVHTRTQGEVVKQPKSAKGYRTIPISPTLSSLLLRGCNGDSVCGVSSHDITRMWGRFSKYNNLPPHLNFHALRHAFASNCLINGIPQKYTAELMGHSGTTMIDTVYQHTFPSAMQEYSKRLVQNAENLLTDKR